MLTCHWSRLKYRKVLLSIHRSSQIHLNGTNSLGWDEKTWYLKLTTGGNPGMGTRQRKKTVFNSYYYWTKPKVDLHLVYNRNIIFSLNINANLYFKHMETVARKRRRVIGITTVRPISKMASVLSGANSNIVAVPWQRYQTEALRVSPIWGKWILCHFFWVK